MQNSSQDVDLFLESLLTINQVSAEDLLRSIYNESNEMKKVEYIISTSLKIIGDGWEVGEYSLAQVYMAGVICEEIFDKLFPESEIKRIDMPKIAICVYLDHHALGKRIVKSVIRSNGYEIIDLGEGLNAEDLVRECLENKIDILLISTLMLSSALKISEVSRQFFEKGIKSKIIVGGAPFRFDRKLWERLGVDSDCQDASDIISVIERLVSKK